MQQIRRQPGHALDRLGVEQLIVRGIFAVKLRGGPLIASQQKAHSFKGFVLRQLFPQYAVRVEKGPVRNAEILAAGIERIHSRQRRLKITLGLVDDHPPVFSDQRRNAAVVELGVIIDEVDPLVLPRRELLCREKIPADAVEGPGNALARTDLGHGIADEFRDPQLFDLPCPQQPGQRIAPAVEGDRPLMQHGQAVAVQLDIAADFSHFLIAARAASLSHICPAPA